MTLQVSELSIRELKDRLGSPEVPITAALLGELERDSRSGVRALYQAVLRRQQAARGERARLRAMLRGERELWRRGLERVAGVDEAGMAPLAGPVVAAAVVFAPTTPGAAIEGVDDSKKLDPERREALAARIREVAVDVGIGLADVADIERHNIHGAGLLAMRRAVEALARPPEHVLVDARTIPAITIPQQAKTRGDAHHYAIAAASILAKTHRDRLMNELDRAYPGYGFGQHKGYPTADHQRAIQALGPCPAHRTSFAHFRELLGECSPAFYELARALEAAGDGHAVEAAEARLKDARDTLAPSEYRKLRILLGRRRNRR